MRQSCLHTGKSHQCQACRAWVDHYVISRIIANQRLRSPKEGPSFRPASAKEGHDRRQQCIGPYHMPICSLQAYEAHWSSLKLVALFYYHYPPSFSDLLQLLVLKWRRCNNLRHPLFFFSSKRMIGLFRKLFCSNSDQKLHRKFISSMGIACRRIGKHSPC